MAYRTALVGSPRPDLWAGIDPGVSTGFALWNPITRSLIRVESMKAVEAEQLVKLYYDDMRSIGKVLHVVVEDTRKMRLPSHLQSKGRDRGAGSVSRDMGRWDEYLKYYNVPYTMAGISPKAFRNGDDAWFRKTTGWTKRTNEHGRAAAGLIYNR